MPFIICANCRLEKMNHGKGLCASCYQAKYRSESDPLGSEHQIRKARKLIRTLGSRILVDVSELLEHCCPYFARKEELMATTHTINTIRQRELSHTDDEVRVYAEQLANEVKVDAVTVPKTKKTVTGKTKRLNAPGKKAA
jgi:NMD protein affecting ribosome stability and mRNA decay